MANIGTCCVHIVSHLTDDKLIISSKVSEERILNCVQLWMNIDGIERTVSCELQKIFNGDEEFSLYYHRRCYMRFTDKRRIQKAQKKIENVELEGEPKIKKRICRSTGGSSSLFPCVCIICEKDQFVRQIDHKRKKEKLMQCQTYNASDSLIKSATLKADETLLIKIRDVDCIAKELKYHRSCYLAYTRVLTKRKTTEIPEIHPCFIHYRTFCDSIIENSIIAKCEIIHMNKLNKFLVDIITKNEPELLKEISITNRQLKRWLIKDYPQLIFVKPKQRNLPEIVLCNSDRQSAIAVINQESTTETASTDEIQTSNCNSIEEEAKRNLYKSALYMKKLICESPPLNCIWPPTAEDLNEENVMQMIPPLLYNFLVWCTGESDEVEMSTVLEVAAESKTKLLSIAQDIIYFSAKGRRPTPKHYSLAMSVRHITGSAKLINMLHGLGHCISHTAVLEYDTGLAEMQLDLCSALPTGIEKKKFTSVVWDNIDFCEETQSGHNTTHHTNGIIIQKNNPVCKMVLKKGVKSGKRTIEPPITHISEYHMKKKWGPQNDFSLMKLDETDRSVLAKNMDTVYILSKILRDTTDPLPGWTGFNVNICTDIIPISIIKYLPVIEANPTEISTIYTILLKSIDIANQLEVENLVLVFDQAIYAKIQQIRWINVSFNKRLIVRLGEFHTAMSFLSIIGKRFKDAGLTSILIESELVAEGSINGVISGKHYNRSVRAHKLLFEALNHLLWGSFLYSETEEFRTKVYLFSTEICQLYLNRNLNENTIPQNLTEIMEHFNKFIEVKCKENPTFSFWMSYLDIVACFLRFIRATRTGDWILHLKTIDEMIPWYFSYDKINYARYLPIYFLEMVNLEKTHPYIHKKMLAGGFVAQRQADFNFSGTALDQVIEQTANRDSKTKGGLIGITKNPGAVHRWMLSHHLRAQISLSCEQLSGKSNETKMKNDLSKAQIKKDEKCIQQIISTVTSMVNPFTYEEGGLINIASGLLADKNVQKELETAKDIGKRCYDDYCKHHIHSKIDKDIFTPIKRNGLLTFSDIGKDKQKSQTSKNLKISTNILARLIVKGQSSSINMNEIMSHSLSEFPPSISNENGTLAKTNKAALIHNILSLVEHQKTVNDFSGKKVLIIDGMAFLQQMNSTIESFGEFAIRALDKIIDLSVYYEVETVHFVTDTYPDISIKNCERNRRNSTGDAAIIRITNSNQRIPKQFKKFLSVGKNKESLIEFLFEEWKKTESCHFKNVVLIMTHKNLCHQLTPSNDKIICLEMPELNSDHEEADTKMILHAFYSSRTSASIIIKSCDTDVFILCFAMCSFITANLYVVPGVPTYPSVVDISQIFHKLGPEISTALIGLHCFTGCDSCSAFKGKGKVKAFKLMQNNNSYVKAFQHFGTSLHVDSKIINVLEQFVCELYGQPKCKLVNNAREVLFKIKLDIGTTLPPNYDSLLCHIKRANYQSYLYNKCLKCNIKAPSPSGYGWIISCEVLQIQWHTIPPLPDTFLKQVSCSCQKTSCSTNICTCKSKNVFCNEMCKCSDLCGNHTEQNIDVEDESDNFDCSESEDDI